MAAKINKIRMNCPICDKIHDVEERKRYATTLVKGEKVRYMEKYLFCENANDDENEFETGTMMDENLLCARNAYRIKMGLLTSDDIVAIRASYGLSQVDLSNLLGWGEVTISRYESKAIQDEAYDTMLRLVKDNPLQALDLLKKNESEFSEAKKVLIRNKIKEKMDSYGKEFLTRQAFEGEYVPYGEASDSNGYTTLNIDKIEAAISYIAEHVTDLYKVKLMKMLWYADALSAKRYGHAITGLVYTHEKMGALPVGHYSLMNLENLNVSVEEGYDFDVRIRIYAIEGMKYDIFSKDEIDVLDAVIKKFKRYNSSKIVDYMHKENAYLKTKKGEIIPFSLAREIKNF